MKEVIQQQIKSAPFYHFLLFNAAQYFFFYISHLFANYGPFHICRKICFALSVYSFSHWI